MGPRDDSGDASLSAAGGVVGFTVHITGSEEVKALLDRVDPSTNTEILRSGLRAAAYDIQKNAADIQIAGGGGGKNAAAPPLGNRLTSRTGHLRSHIKVDERHLPYAIEVGTDVKYGAVHEFGGVVDKPSRVIKEHKRRVVFGRRVAPFTVPSHFRMGHTARYPKRPFMKPALDAVFPRFGEIFTMAWEKAAGL